MPFVSLAEANTASERQQTVSHSYSTFISTSPSVSTFHLGDKFTNPSFGLKVPYWLAMKQGHYVSFILISF